MLKCSVPFITGEAINTIEADIVSEEELRWIEEQQKEIEQEGRGHCKVCMGREEEFVPLHEATETKCISDDAEVYYHPAQMEFDFAKDMPRKNHVVETRICTRCRTPHFTCPHCEESNAVLDEDFDSIRECLGCGMLFEIDTSRDFDRVGENYIYRVVRKSNSCEKCGKEYKEDGTGNNACPECEDAYVYS